MGVASTDAVDFLHKLKKLKTVGDPETYARAKVKAERLLSRRNSEPLTAEALMGGLDAKKVRDIRSRYGIENPGIAWQKYVEFERWFSKYITRAEDLGLDFGRRKRILDIGSGAGFFLYVCKKLGHDCVGLDFLEGEHPGSAEFFAEAFALFGLPRVIWRITAFVPLPDLGAPFDLVTAFMINFDDPLKNRWKRAEWEFFMDDLQARMRPGGQVRLELNPGPGRQIFHTAVREFFEERGGIFEGPSRVTFGVDKDHYERLRRLIKEERRKAHQPAE